MRPDHAAAFTLVEIMVVVAIIGLLMSVATVGISHAIKTAQRKACDMNVEAIDSAKQMWMLDSKKSENDVATEEDLKPILKNNTSPACPSGGTYSINANNVRAICSVHGAGTTSVTPASQ